MWLVLFIRKLTDVKHKLVCAGLTRMSPERFEDLFNQSKLLNSDGEGTASRPEPDGTLGLN